MKKRFRLALIIVCIVVLVWIRVFSPENKKNIWLSTQSLLTTKNTPMKISTDFVDNGPLPSKYTCDGEGYFPQLTVENISTDVKSLALIVDDPDASGGVRDHLLLANIPVDDHGAVTISQDSFDVWILGQNGRWEQAWWAPCPPSGIHRYIFKIYALSDMLEISSWFSKERLLELMWGRIVDQKQIVGLYKRD